MSVTVELMELPETPQLCPVRAFWDWRHKSSKTIPLEAAAPVFRFSSGKNITPATFNKYLKMLLKEDVVYGSIVSHSFRAGEPNHFLITTVILLPAGLVTALARLGVSEERCQLVGRWHSSAWLSYAREGRGVRLAEMRDLSRRVLAAATIFEPPLLVEDEDWRVNWG